MLRAVCLLVALALLLPAASKADDRCLMINHDGTFEDSLAWGYDGVQCPYYGAFGEAYDVGYGLVFSAHLWLSQDGTYNDQTFDLYMWWGGFYDAPGSVAYMEPGLSPYNLPIWPEVGENVYDTEVFIEGTVTIGFWGNWPGQPAGFFVGSDEEGINPGHPWTYVAPQLPWPSGWQHPDVIWDRRHTEALGLGVDVDREPSPAEAPSWGAIKALFR